MPPTRSEWVDGEDVESLRSRIGMIRGACRAALTVDELITIAVAQAKSALQACAGTLLLVDGDDLVVAAVDGYPQQLTESFARTPLSADTPAGRAARSRRAVWLGDPATKVREFPALQPKVTGFAGLAALPLVAEDAVLGVLGISFRQAREFTEVEQLYLLVLADQVAAALRRLTVPPPAGHALIDDDLVADPERRQAVEDLSVALADASAGLDRLTALAARLCGAPSAQVSLIGAEQVVAGSAGAAPSAGTTGRAADSLCTVTMSLRSPLVVADAAADDRVSALPPVRVGGVRAYLGVPLSIEGRPVGALCVYDQRVRDWSPEARGTLEVLADSVSTELRLRSLAARDARLAQASRERTTLVDRLAAAVSLRQVAAVLADAVSALPGVIAAAVVRLDADGGPQTLAARCAVPEGRHAVAALASAAVSPPAAVLELADLAEASTGDTARLARLGIRRAAMVPLTGQTARGTLLVAVGDGFDPAHGDHLAELAPIATAVFDRGAIHEQHRLARARAAFLTTASAQLQSSLDVDDTLQRLARLVVPALADGCLVHLRAHRALRLSAVGHVDGRIERLLRQEASTSGALTEAVQRCLAGGAAEVSVDHPLLTLDRLRILPLRARGRAIGAITLIQPRPGGQPGLADPALLAELATRAAVATDNALLYAKRSADVAALQYRLLPPRLPQLPAFDLAAHYAAGDASLDVGGDFYDVVALAEDHFVLVIGDVCGRGADAASVTGHARSVVRTVLEDGASPAAALTRLNRALLATGQFGEFCTAVVAEVRGAGDACAVRLAVAGHPRPLLRRAGTVTEVGPGGPMLGMVREPVYRQVELALTVDDVLLLFTDGVTEARRGDELFGVDRLADTLASGRGAADVAVEEVRAAVERFRDRGDDDVAMLAVRPRGRPLARVDLPDLADVAARTEASARLDALLPTDPPAARRTLLRRVAASLARSSAGLDGPAQLAVFAVPGGWRAELIRPLPGPRGADRATVVRHGVQTIMWTEIPVRGR
ncbi:SpoIIE family protein phosphatase [Micromonospora auratinigra]|uniref:SpoIIE family protein phosphatase n=1 Tax=Micromonospora auratinigra TaxID=261654 RepID=UPI000B83E802|nr:SpoIIE family protein phosphatase [Micromonospora auratinigra]